MHAHSRESEDRLAGGLPSIYQPKQLVQSRGPSPPFVCLPVCRSFACPVVPAILTCFFCRACCPHPYGLLLLPEIFFVLLLLSFPYQSFCSPAGCYRMQGRYALQLFSIHNNGNAIYLSPCDR